MNDDAEPWIKTQEADFGGWVACLVRGTLRVWFAGGPGIGRIGYGLANQDAASAAVALEMGKFTKRLTAERKAALENMVANCKLLDRMEVISEEVENAPGFKVVSVLLDGRSMGHLVEINENDEAWFDECVSEDIEGARRLALFLSGTGDPGPGGGPGGR